MAILGACVGDMVGAAFDMGYQVKTTKFEFWSEHSVYTDDTVMTLSVAAALQESLSGNLPLSLSLIRSMKKLGGKYADVGYGERFKEWIDSEEMWPYWSYGNGAAMRVSAVAWAYSDLPSVLLVARETALVTHNTPGAIKAAQATAACIFLARTGASGEEMRSYVRERFGYPMDQSIAELRLDYGFDSTYKAVPPAIEAALEADSFENSVRLAVSLGGDTDTQGAIAASIGQARFGIPPEIEREARRRLSDDLLAINDTFCDAYSVGGLAANACPDRSDT